MREFPGNWMRHTGDFWGGIAAMLVALPASVAFGVTVYSAVSPDFGPFGALAGVLGAMALGLVAPIFGGTDRLISAPCAPAAVVLTAFAIEMTHQGTEPASIVMMLTVLSLLTGLLQILIGFLGVGRLIKYIPYPVVSGYLSGVGLIIIMSQIPKFAGAPVDAGWFQVLISPQHWDWRGLLIGGVTILTMIFSGKITRKVPPTIVGITSGLLTYGCISIGDTSLWVLEGNSLVIGSLGASTKGYINLITDRWHQIGEFKLAQVANLAGSAVILAALLSIDTLKTCVVLDQKTRSRHDSDRELIAQGLGNGLASIIGGMPGAGTMGASMVNLSSGAQTRISGVVEGVATLVVVLALGSFVSWIPVATLSGVLIVVGFHMIDTDPFRFLESRSTALDFLVVLAVICVALSVDLIAASIVGVILSIILFLREQVGGNIIRRKSFVGQRSSTWSRPEREMRILEAKGETAVIFELQGSLFFGTAQQLYRALEPELLRRDFVILDLRRTQSVDITAAHSLALAYAILVKREAPLLLTNVAKNLPNGRDLEEFLQLSGLMPDGKTLLFLPTLEAGIEWVEDRLLDGGNLLATDEPEPLKLSQIEIFKGTNADTLADLEASLEICTWKANDIIYTLGEPDTDLYLIAKGQVKITARIGLGVSQKHIATAGAGDFFGTLGFLDHQARSNEAIAMCDSVIYVLSQENFNRLAAEHRQIALVLATKLARILAVRLRHIDKELALLQDGN